MFEGQGGEDFHREQTDDSGILMSSGEGHDEQFHDREAKDDGESSEKRQGDDAYIAEV